MDESMNGGQFDFWNANKREGHLDELCERCQEFAIPHRLKSAIHKILGSLANISHVYRA